jgi:DNA helicase-2/ATP-dependent DNA helicase PcrA
LYITHAETRRLFGSETYPRASRFVHEIPNELIHEVRLRGSVSQPKFAGYQDSYDDEDEDTSFYLGQRVVHAKFGEGIVLNFEGQGSHARVQVNFDEVGSKWLVVAFANLQVAESHF